MMPQLSTDLNNLDGFVSYRAYSILHELFADIADIRSLGPKGLMTIPGIGRAAVRDIEKAIGGWDDADGELTILWSRISALVKNDPHRAYRRRQFLTEELRAMVRALESVTAPE